MLKIAKGAVRAHRAVVVGLTGLSAVVVGLFAPAVASAQTTTTVPIDPVSQSTALIATAAPIAGEVLGGIAGTGIMVLLLWWGIGKVWGFFHPRKASV